MSNPTHCFVPLHENILYPAWSKQVSLDMPFRAGWYGFIRLRITARTPLYVRQAYLKRSKKIPLSSEQHAQWVDFFRIGGEAGK
jgi:hypothetical protein